MVMALQGSMASSKMAAILEFAKNSNLSENRKLQIFFARAVKYDTSKHFAAFSYILSVFTPKKDEQYALLFKNCMTTCYL